MYYTIIEIIWKIANFIYAEISPILVRARLLIPVSTDFTSDSEQANNLPLRKKNISLMENDRPLLDEYFHLVSLSKILGIKRNRTSEITNRYFGYTIIELLREYRICEAQKNRNESAGVSMKTFLSKSLKFNQ